MYGNRVPRKMSGLNREDVTEDNSIMRRFVIFNWVDRGEMEIKED
jgi:hypothetical protein